MQPIRRGFVTVGGRQVHYRTAGSGPPVVLVPQSPTSAKTLDLQTATFAKRFTAIAIDVPGLGQSDPIPNVSPTVEDMAICLADTLDALGIKRTALYGSHTGASICVEFGRRFPERTTQVMVDGYPIYTDAERARRLASYFGSFDPRWDGGHLLWVWARYREQYLFYPWNAPGRGTRAQIGMPDTAFLHRGAIDLLTAGNGYVRAYTAAYTFDAARAIREITVPTVFLAYRDDPLTQAHGLLADLPDCCRIERMPEDHDAGVARELELLTAVSNPGPAVTLPATGRLTDGITRSYVDVADGQLALRQIGTGPGRPLVALPPAPGSATRLSERMAFLAADRPVLALDLPGCGDSDPFPAAVGSIGALTDPIEEALKTLGLDDCDLYGLNGGAFAALELGRRTPARSRRLIVEGLPFVEPGLRGELAERYASPIAVHDDGTHWLSLWHAVRSEQLFWPWYRQTEGAVRPIDPDLNPTALTEMVLSYMKHPANYDQVYRAVFAYDAQPAIEAQRDRIAFFAKESDVFFQATFQAASDVGSPATQLTNSALETAIAFRGALDV